MGHTRAQAEDGSKEETAATGPIVARMGRVMGGHSISDLAWTHRPPGSGKRGGRQVGGLKQF